MRVLSRVLVVLLLAGIELAQGSIGRPDKTVEVRRLILVSPTLPEVDREQVSRLFANREFSVAELEERVRWGFQHFGYYKVAVSHPTLSAIGHGKNTDIVDVTISVDEGLQYRIRDISFTGGTAFSADRMRKVFPGQAGEVFNRDNIAKGLEELHKLYGAEGYIDFTSVPDVRLDDTHKTIDLIIDCDEGGQFRFGALALDGAEPHLGDGQALLQSYAKLRGTPYNPAALDKWFAQNKSHLSAVATAAGTMLISTDRKEHLMNVKLVLP